MTELKVETRGVRELIPYAANSRTHSDAQIAQIAASIKEFGWTNPILIDGDDTIIAGHGRLMAARKLGYEDVPVIVIDHLTKSQQRALVIADNQLALNAGWDMEMLKAEIEGLNFDGFDLDLLGFSDEELKEFLEELDGSEGLDGEKYTTKITVPIYEITGKKPNLEEMFDAQKAQSLIKAIEDSEEISDDVKGFLKAAAYRHVKFNYENIAEFYAHADESLRKLMRDSALVIIDYDAAIENGYIKLTKELMELSDEKL